MGQVESMAKTSFKLVKVTAGVRVKPVKSMLAISTSESLIRSHLSGICSSVISRH